MSETIKYKGYDGLVTFCSEDNIFHGKIEGIRSLITFEGDSVDSLKEAFKEAVEDYLLTCEEHKIEAEKPFKGSLNIRIGKDLHRKAFLFAKRKRTNINQVIKEALRKELVNH